MTWQDGLQFLLALTIMLTISWMVEETYRRREQSDEQKRKLERRMRRYRLTKV